MSISVTTCVTSQTASLCRSCSRLIRKRNHDEDHAEKSQDDLRRGADEVADEHPARSPRGPLPVTLSGPPDAPHPCVCVFFGSRGPSPAPPEILAAEDAAYSAGEEAEEGPDAEEEGAS